MSDSEVSRGGSARVLCAYDREQMQRFGRSLGVRAEEGDLFGLVGDLGSGKTCFVRGIAEGMEIPAHRVRSPSFTLVNEYGGGRLPLYHIDLYRVAPADVDSVALREYLYGDGVCAVEWFDHVSEAAAHLQIRFTFVAENERMLVATAFGERYDALLHSWLRGENEWR